MNVNTVFNYLQLVLVAAIVVFVAAVAYRKWFRPQAQGVEIMVVAAFALSALAIATAIVLADAAYVLRYSVIQGLWVFFTAGLLLLAAGIGLCVPCYWWIPDYLKDLAEMVRSLFVKKKPENDTEPAPDPYNPVMPASQ